jgi:hypothetical protein
VIIIIDSGGTKADWKIIDAEGSVHSQETEGYSPLLHDDVRLNQILLNLDIVLAEVNQVYYYGSGVHADLVRSGLHSLLQQHFTGAEINIASDLLGACRAASGTAAGIVSILGTGASTCVYDGQHIIDQVPSLGYILGDEGSGYALGKRIVQAFFYREMPADIHELFVSGYPIDKSIVLDNVYKSSSANAFIASLANFAVENKQHPYIRALIREEFDQFIRRHLLKYEESGRLKCHFVGSLSWLLRDELCERLAAHRLSPGTFVRKPIDRLADFHTMI